MKLAAVLALLALPAQADVRATGAYWDWQLTSPIDLDADVEVLVLELSEVSPADIAALKARGVKTVCYISVGTAENYRDDYAAFPAAVLGDTYGDWPDERFLDIRATDVLLPIMQDRIDRCAAHGFDAIEPDNMDGFENETGFDLTEADTVRYITDIAGYARSKGLEIAQKNAPTLVDKLVGQFDFAIVESCYEYDFCEDYDPYILAGKDVLAAEYPEAGVNMAEVCSFAANSPIKFLFKPRELTAGYLTC